MQVFLAGHIAGMPVQTITIGFQQCRQAAESTGHGQHLGAALQQGRAQRQADTGTGAGNHGQAILEFASHQCSPMPGDTERLGHPERYCGQPVSNPEQQRCSRQDLFTVRERVGDLITISFAAQHRMPAVRGMRCRRCQERPRARRLHIARV
ncbi:hypothetical protein D3C80_1496180 [compost metagenome]